MNARKPSVSENIVCVRIPRDVTSLGNSGCACWTRFCTLTSAISAFVPVLNVIVSE